GKAEPAGEVACLSRSCAICRELLRADYEGKACPECGQWSHYGCSDRVARGHDACRVCGAPKAGTDEGREGGVAPQTPPDGPGPDQRKPPSLAWVVVTDHACGLCFFGTLGLWVFTGLTSIPGWGNLPAFLLFCSIAATVFCLPIVGYRAARIRRVF